jgi:hypothetical protein
MGTLVPLFLLKAARHSLYILVGIPTNCVQHASDLYQWHLVCARRHLGPKTRPDVNNIAPLETRHGRTFQGFPTQQKIIN